MEWMEVQTMRLIDADAALERVKPYSRYDVEWVCTGETVKRIIRDAINNAPTVDAVEVVRCKDCKYYDECTNFLFDDDYCSRGERK